MTFDEMTEAVAEARRTLHIADSQTEKMIGLVAGKLRSASTAGWGWANNLRKLKEELRRFDSRSGCWK